MREKLKNLTRWQWAQIIVFALPITLYFGALAILGTAFSLGGAVIVLAGYFEKDGVGIGPFFFMLFFLFVSLSGLWGLKGGWGAILEMPSLKEQFSKRNKRILIYLILGLVAFSIVLLRVYDTYRFGGDLYEKLFGVYVALAFFYTLFLIVRVSHLDQKILRLFKKTDS